MRSRTFLGLAAVSAALVALAPAPAAHADLIYMEKGTLPEVEPVPGYSPLGGEVVRDIVRRDDTKERVTLFGIRGRVVDVTEVEGAGLVYHYQLLMVKSGAKPGDLPSYRYHPDAVEIPQMAIHDFVNDLDSLYDLRVLLGNDDLRLGELAAKDPRVLADHYGAGNAQAVVKLIERGEDWVYAFLGYGGVESRRMMAHRVGLGGITFEPLRRAQLETPYQEGWLTYVVRKGAPKDTAELHKAVAEARARGEVLPYIRHIPLRMGAKFKIHERARIQPPTVSLPGGGTRTVRPRHTPPPLVVGAQIKPAIRKLILAAARDDRWRGVLLNSDSPEKGPLFHDMALKILRELCGWSRVPGRGEVAERARAVGREAREAVIEALEAGLPGRHSRFDAMREEVPAGKRRGSDQRLTRFEYLPVDPSREALVALRVIQDCPAWRTPQSPSEAKRLVEAMVRLARRSADPKDPRAVDFARRVARGQRSSEQETFYAQEVRATLASASRGGLLVPSGADRNLASPFLPHLVDMLSELHPDDRPLIQSAMTEAGAGSAALYAPVIDRLFALCLEDWSGQAPPAWVARSKREAIATLGFLIDLERRENARQARVAGGNTAPATPVSDMVFAHLDPMADAMESKRANPAEQEFFTLLRGLHRASDESMKARWLPQVAKSRSLASELAEAYTVHAASAPREAMARGRSSEAKAFGADADRARERTAEMVRSASERAEWVRGFFNR